MQLELPDRACELTPNVMHVLYFVQYVQEQQKEEKTR